MAKQYPCPACGAEIPFKSAISVYGVCAFCQTMVVRRDVDVEKIGTMAELPGDMSPLQIGSHGVFESQNFEVLGRLKIACDEGQWNEWFCAFGDGKEAWLFEAQGFFALATRRQDFFAPRASELKVGSTLKVPPGKIFEVDDIKRNTCVGSEGELPFVSPKGRESVTLDLTGPDETYASIEYSEKQSRIFTGRYVTLTELRMKNLREFEGWKAWRA